MLRDLVLVTQQCLNSSLKDSWGWRAGSAVKSTCYFCRQPVFYQHLHGGSEQSLTPVPEDLKPILASAGITHAHGT